MRAVNRPITRAVSRSSMSASHSPGFRAVTWKRGLSIRKSKARNARREVKTAGRLPYWTATPITTSR
jgi:hypothetical protein